MICLLRNLSAIPRPVMGFDVLPPNTEVHDGADLARVKYYRNKIAHSEIDRLPTPEFTTVWSDLEKALVRLGRANIQALCDDIKQAVLNHDILVEVRNDISQFHGELQLQAQQMVDLNNKIEELASTSRGIKRKIEECSCSDALGKEIEEWEELDKIFVKTHVVDVILQKLQTNPSITVTGKPGMGKSAIIHHIALLLHRSQGYTVFPCTSPREIKSHFKKDHLQVFVFDDVCGRYAINHYDVGEWVKHQQNIKRILIDKKTKVLSSCRLQVFLEKQFQNINLLKSGSIDLTMDENSFTMHEKTQIALQYLDEDDVDRCRDVLEKCEFLPLMCFLCKQNSPVNVRDFLSHPFDIYTNELNLMEIEFDKTKWFALFLCILHNGKIEESFFEQDHGHWRQEFQSILDQCGVNIGTSTMYVKSQLESLVGTYVKKTGSIVEHDTKEKYYKVFFTVIHDKMLDFLSHYYGSNQQKIFIKHAKASMLGERTQLETLKENHDQFKVIITRDNEAEFLQRSLKIWKNGGYTNVLNYDQMKFQKFREKIISYIKLLDPVHRKMSCYDLETALNIVCKAGYYDVYCFLLEHKSDININHDELLQSACYGGNEDIAKDLINMGAHVNTITSDYFAAKSSPLIEACTRGHLPIVTLLIDKGADINQTTDDYSPLILACKGGHLSIVTLLINKGADINQTTDMYSPLISACIDGHLPIVTLLIDKGADFNRTAWIYSPLMSACKGGNLPIVTLLIHKGADVNQETRCYSPLISACRDGHLPIVSLLIQKGAKLNQTVDIYSPLIAACIGGHLPIVELLINLRADVNHATWSYSPLISSCKGNHLPIVTLLIDKGANVNKTTRMYSPLISACRLSYLPIVTLLTDKGADVNQTTQMYSPLISACEGGHLQLVTLLIDKGANVNQATKQHSPLISACRGGNLKLVTLLIEKGVYINQISDMYSPLSVACKGGHLPIVNLLVDQGADVNQTTDMYSPLISACISGHLSTVSLLIDKGASVNQTTKQYTPLTSACKGGCFPIVTLLIEKGALINLPSDMSSPLSAACKSGHFPIVTLLIDQGANVNQTTNQYSPLLSACISGNLSIVTLLIDKGANVNQTTNQYSPLISVCKRGNLPIVILLLEKGADINQTTDMYSPLIAACEGGHLPIVSYLIDKGANLNLKNSCDRTPLYQANISQNAQVVNLLVQKGAIL